MTARLRPGSEPLETCSPVVDLRQYTLHPGTLDSFVELFDREFVETQEAAGMRIIGQFRDLGDPNRFVWMRGFPDMPSRAAALASFYGAGDAWRTHGGTANSMMIDSSDALLLRPARPGGGFVLESAARRPPPGSAAPAGLVVATIHHVPDPAEAGFLDFFEDVVGPAQADAGASFLGLFATEHAPNNFQHLPLREGENVVVSFAGHGDLTAYHRYMTVLGGNPRWRDGIYPELTRRLSAPPQILRLAPTSRSQLRA
ncbi:NIPSNAP family protein [Arenibaculum sp.]|uniref:NIPSNAP family protein n=1 Tax=Arenibaculum sp. TaxID=2865862 RepID=UPI002E133996|nr:NIPSNAP family protein [Arenibaculum sp.]